MNFSQFEHSTVTSACFTNVKNTGRISGCFPLKEKMLQIRLKRDPSSEAVVGGKPLPTDRVTVACPDHLVLANLPVAKVLGAAASNSVVKVVGRKSRRQLGERVHFCVKCDFPIAIYGRLVSSSPCFMID